MHVFHTFPFLQATHEAFESCRTFIRITLPQHQARAPKILDETAQTTLEHEMDNERSRLVYGDGGEVNAEAQKVVAETDEQIRKAEEDQTASDDGVPATNSDHESDDPSWRPVTDRDEVPQLHVDGRSEDGGSATVANTAAEADRPLRRIRSAIHSVASKAKATVGTHVRPRNHRRTPSYYRVRFGLADDEDDESSSRPPSPAFSRHSRARSGSISSNASGHTTLMLAPAPHIRASHRALSHPDISSLCKTWSNSSNATAENPGNPTDIR